MIDVRCIAGELCFIDGEQLSNTQFAEQQRLKSMGMIFCLADETFIY